MKIDEIYQGHDKALSKSGLAPKIYPTLREIWKEADAFKLNNDANLENRSGGRECTTYFCIGISKIWRENIYNIIKKLRDCNSIKWLRTRMSYHRFPNLGETPEGYLVSKIRRNLASKDFLDGECNCNTTAKVKGRCAYRGECRRCCVIYKVTWKCCGDFYVGNTQNTLKKGTTLPICSTKSRK